MATQTLSAPRTAAIREKVDAFFASIGQGMNAYMERRSRMDQINNLEAKTDEELSKLGIKRDRIVQHVFRDLFYV
ncbi:hypothetical protein [Loktanella salsilacus]|jgi:uncharacterized protein YjiS (DUF1127 family)|uniref:DUF1127 domain-containing protein n=1 Tax=Loktanella salsilacus TaxID=195913 RepID=A0A1I4DFR1_9RHOB|nr:hypothetical protein [Loktanella salsilacus]MBU0780459.1 hypothetical protein [Alphaproteobacteria bacterium]MBU0860818.1 hypothetical protein [Alphaproteobacteria bacterium]MBU1835606.1 hypothetical protein [Alphaproteobacteria bacterium]UTH44231.1 hypothetical protein KBK07_14325 [Loktanella salsilacus]UTH47939.1 hypothetical protein KBW81_14765 [Loktanella salsilacus]|tara:strand:+ start:692 stop:916 length:225 start_codon:yes stop_codon:yes gene_type:complete